MKRSVTFVVLAVTVVCFGAALMAQSRSAPTPLPGIEPLPPLDDVSSSDRDAATPPEAPDPVPPTPIQPIMPPNKCTLTIVNVMKAEVLLFRVPAAGNLEFLRKLVHGDVLDLKAVEGERFTAIFTSREPYQMGFTVEKANATWLLRAPETTASVRELPSGVVPSGAPTQVGAEGSVLELPTAERLTIGLGVNSDSGVTGSIIFTPFLLPSRRPWYCTPDSDHAGGNTVSPSEKPTFLESLPGWKGSLHAQYWPKVSAEEEVWDRFHFGFTR
jgi:hypothetical protein